MEKKNACDERDDVLEMHPDYSLLLGIESLRRYGGHPDLLLKEHPRRDLEMIYWQLHGPASSATEACQHLDGRNLYIEPLKNLSAEESGVQRRSIRQLLEDPQGHVNRYSKTFGNDIGSDNASELFPEYSVSREARAANRIAVARPAAWVIA